MHETGADKARHRDIKRQLLKHGYGLQKKRCGGYAIFDVSCWFDEPSHDWRPCIVAGKGYNFSLDDVKQFLEDLNKGMRIV